MIRLQVALLFTLASSASPALAAGGAQIPEASSMMLFALGAAGVLIGRKLSSRK